jgi:arylsulfatase A-like enzyme
MTEPNGARSPGAFADAVLLVAAAYVGVVLPLDFLLEVDGYLMIMRPAELFPVWGWAWLFYAAFGILAGVAAFLVGRLIALAFRRPAEAVVDAVALWTALSLIVVALVRAAKLWIGLRHAGIDEWLTTYQAWVGAVVLLACAIAVRRAFIDRKHVRRPMVLFAACGLAMAAAAPLVCFIAKTSPASPRRDAVAPVAGEHPDIILVTADAFAANHAGFLGYVRPTTPRLNALAGQSDVFERYYANGNFTTAAVNSFINGVRPWTHRANQFLARVNANIADESLVARLWRAGYQTDAVWTNSLAAPFHNQSDRWLDSTVFATTNYAGPMIASVMCTRFSHFAPVTELGAFITSKKIIDSVALWTGVWTDSDQDALEPAFSHARSLVEARDRSRPLFLWVHVLRPHSPYVTPAPYLGRFDSGPEMRTRANSSPANGFFTSKADDTRVPALEARYDESLEYFDASVGDFIDWLKAKGELAGTLLVVSSDHGESFSHRYGAHAGPMLYEDVIHVPLIIKEPGQTESRRVVALAEQIDLMPTLLALARVNIDGPVEGISLVPAIGGADVARPVFSMNFEQNSRFKDLTTGSIAMMDGRWKYVRYLGKVRGPLVPTLKDELYDLKADPGENTDVSSTEPDIAARMSATIEQQLQEHAKAPR